MTWQNDKNQAQIDEEIKKEKVQNDWRAKKGKTRSLGQNQVKWQRNMSAPKHKQTTNYHGFGVLWWFFALFCVKKEYQSVLDFQKKILGPTGPQVFIFGHQNKYSSRQKLYLRINGKQ